ncbi:MAG: KAP family P-loop NTPase fold protein [Marinobacter adhaerens]
MPETADREQSGPPDYWKDDRLGRWEQAEFLTQFMVDEHARLCSRADNARENGLTRKPRHFVLNIDSSWGFGKTFFLDRWQQDLEAQHHLVLKFNAWESDYSKDPLVSFLSEIGSQLVQKLQVTSESGSDGGAQANAVNWDILKQKSAALLRNYGPGVALRVAIAAISAGLTGYPYLGGAVSQSSGENADTGEPETPDTDVSGARGPIPERSIDKVLEHIASVESADLFEAENSRKQALTDFRQTLSTVVQSVEQHQNSHNQYYKLPVFIFVDELDRCRPDFTIELLEVVKHIFSVDDVFFVFATDGQQLQASLAGMYGHQFDAEIYFKRIFSREVHLRRPNNRQFTEALIAEYGILEEQHATQFLINVSNRQVDLEAVIDDFVWVSDVFSLTLRDQHQLAASFDSVFRFRRYKGNKTCTAITLVLLVFWNKRKRLFKDLVNNPEDFSVESKWGERLKKDFPLYDRKALLKTASHSAQNGVEDISILTALATFSSSLSLTKRDVTVNFQSNAFRYYFDSEICADAFQGMINPPPGSRSPIAAYFDQIMMAR